MSNQTVELIRKGPTPPVKVRISVISGPHSGYELVLSKSCSLTIGRGEQATLRLEDEPHLSRSHAKLEISPDKIFVVDLNSTNGTSLNGMPITEASINDQGVLCFGESQILVRFEGKKAAVNATANSKHPTQKAPSFAAATSSAIEQTITEAALLNSYDTNEFQFSAPLHVDVTNPLLQTQKHSFPVVPGDYEILEPIGNGGMATVFKAKHLPTKDLVAIKFIREEFSDAVKLQKLFAREATILSQLNHPGIVRARHFGVSEEKMYLVMDYIPHMDLLEFIDKKPLVERIRIGSWIMIRVLESLYFAHQRGIVHRDIKPSNILGFRDGRHLKIRLSDFGLAKFYEDAGLGGITEERSIRGTIGFMSPEQLRNSKSVGPPADIYSSGACLYRFITSRYPNHSLSAKNPFDTKVMSSLPSGLVKILYKSVADDPKHRFIDTAQFANALLAFAEKKR